MIMYYKEEWIDGKMMYKMSPKDDWREFSKEAYALRLLEREAEIKYMLDNG